MNKELYYIICSYDPSGNQYYISNTNPIVWTNIFIESKQYLTSKNAEFEILKDYDNYKQIKQMINSQHLDGIYIAEIEKGEESRRIKIL